MKGINPQSWPRIEALFHEAMEQAAEQRAAWLSAQCGGDLNLQEQVTTLLRSATRANDTLDRGIQVRSRPTDDSPQALRPGDRIDRYRIVDRIGAGGMGEVYLAERDDGQYQQQVALKLLKPEAAGQIERFEAERQFLAGLEHPGIARLIDGGLSKDGRPFMVMEYVAGRTLLDYCQHHQLGLEARLDLFEQVCAAVAHAHQQLIVHRDLKSGNILVTAEGRIKLLDFGVAKLLPPEGWNTEDEATRNAPLTPDHAAPEQLSGGRISTATDVYALGVVLFRLLSGRSPWHAMQGLAVSRAVNAVLHEEAPPLSEAVTDGHPVTARALRGDLDAIVARALRKSPSARYPTVEALQEDLRRAHSGLPVEARHGEHLYRARRWLVRHRLPLSVGTVLALLLTGFTLRLAQENRRVVEAHALAQQETRTARAVTEYVTGLFESVAPSQLGGRDIAPRELLDRGRESLAAMDEGSAAAQTPIYRVISQLYGLLGLPAEALQVADQGLRASASLAQPDRLLQAQAAIARYQMREYPQAIAELEAVLQQAPGQWRDPQARIQTQAALAMARLQTGEAAQAESALLEALGSLPPDTPDTWRARLWQPLAVARILAGDADQALTLEQQALSAYREAFGELHPRTIDSMASMATLSYYATRNPQALDWAERVLPLAQKLYGDEAAPTLQIRTTLANILSALGQIRAAIAQQQALLAASANSPAAAQAAGWLNLAGDQLAVGDDPAALASAEQAQTLLQGSDPVEQLRLSLIRAELALRQDDLAQAQAHLDAVDFDDSNGVLAGGYQARRQLTYAQIARRAARLAEAEQALARAEALIQATQSSRSNLHPALQLQRGLLLAAQGDLASATEQVGQALETITQRKGAQAPVTLAYHAQWVAQLLAMDQGEAALAHARPLLTSAREQLDPEAWALRVLEQAAATTSQTGS